MKKTLKRIALFTVLTPFVLLILGVVVYFAVALFAVGGESTEHQAYLRQNMQEINLKGEEEFEIFDEQFYQKKVFFLGEAHGYAMPQELDFKLLKHLNKKVGLTHYLAEVDYSQAHFLNEYLLTGNEQLLNYVFETWVGQGAQWANKNFYQKLQKIYALNQTLNSDSRISIVGVDKIQDMQVTQRHLKETLTSAAYKNGSNASLDTLQLLVSNDSIEIEKLQRFLASYSSRLETGNAMLPLPQSAQIELKHIVLNVKYRQEGVRRDSVMFLNLNTLSSTFGWENEQFYGMWGLFHALQAPVNKNVKSFAALLQHAASPFKNMVVSLSIFSVDSENMMPTVVMPASLRDGKAYVNTTWVNSDGPLVFVNGIKDLTAVTKENSLTIFKIDSDRSPYRTSSRLAKSKILIPGQNIQADGENPVITDACQYVVLIRNSQALTPIKNTI